MKLFFIKKSYILSKKRCVKQTREREKRTWVSLFFDFLFCVQYFHFKCFRSDDCCGGGDVVIFLSTRLLSRDYSFTHTLNEQSLSLSLFLQIILRLRKKICFSNHSWIILHLYIFFPYKIQRMTQQQAKGTTLICLFWICVCSLSVLFQNNLIFMSKSISKFFILTPNLKEFVKFQ